MIEVPCQYFFLRTIVSLLKCYYVVIPTGLEGIIEYLSKVENNEFKLRLMSAINT